MKSLEIGRRIWERLCLSGGDVGFGEGGLGCFFLDGDLGVFFLGGIGSGFFFGKYFLGGWREVGEEGEVECGGVGGGKEGGVLW